MVSRIKSVLVDGFYLSPRSTVDRQATQVFLAQRTFRRNALERLIDIVISLAKRNLAFRGSNKT